MPHGITNILGGTNRGAFSKFHLIFVSPAACKETERSCIVGEVCLKKIFDNRSHGENSVVKSVNRIGFLAL